MSIKYQPTQQTPSLIAQPVAVAVAIDRWIWAGRWIYTMGRQNPAKMFQYIKIHICINLLVGRLTNLRRKMLW